MSGDALGLEYYTYTIYKKLLTVRLKATFYRCKNIFFCGPGPQINLIYRLKII
jgi:hypothetical protein